MKKVNAGAAAAAAPAKKKRNFFVRAIEQWDLQLLVLPGIILLLVFSYFPMYGLIMAFQEYKVSDPFPGISQWVGFKHFIDLFSDVDFFPALRNTLAISGLKLTIGFVCPIFFALFLNEMRHQGTKKVIQTVSYLPHFISWTVCSLLLFDLLGTTGTVNEILLALGIFKNPTNFFQKGDWFWGIALFSDIWKELGWNSIIYISAIAGIDAEMYEAADIDGATRAQKMWHITCKSIKPTIVLLFIMNVGGILNQNFDQIMMLTNQMGNSFLKPYADVIDTFVFRRGISGGRISFGTAAGLFKAVINFILLLVANKIADKAGENALF